MYAGGDDTNDLSELDHVADNSADVSDPEEADVVHIGPPSKTTRRSKVLL